MSESGGSILGVALVVTFAALAVTYGLLRLSEPWAWLIPAVMFWLAVAYGLRARRTTQRPRRR